MNATLCCRISLSAFLLLLITSQPSARAQSTGTSTPAPAARAEASADARWDLNIVKGLLRRQDGKTVPASMGNIIDYLRELFPANIVLAPGVGQVNVGDLKLKSIQWEPALDALRVASGNAFVWKKRPDPSAPVVIDPATGVPVVGGAGGDGSDGEALLMLTLDNSGEIPGPKRIVEVFNLGGYLRGQDKEKQEKNLNEIMEIVEVTLRDFDLGRDGIPSLRFKFHSGASLLIVSGSPGEVEVARKVILALPETSSSKAQSPSSDDAARAAFARRYGLNPAPLPMPAIPFNPTAPMPPPAPKQ